MYSRTKRASRSRWTQPSTLKSSSWSIFCSAMYFAMTSSVTLPELQQKYPRAHRCRPQNCFFRCGNSASKVMCGPALQPLHQAADRHLRRQRDQQMHMVLRHMSLHDRHLMLPAVVPDQIPHPRRDLARQCRSAVFRDSHQMQVNFKNSVRAPPVFRHPQSLFGAHALKAVA